MDFGIRVPAALYNALLPRLLQAGSFGKNWRIDFFLATRCDRAFLALYLQAQPQLLEQIKKPVLRLDAVGEVRIALRLHELKLLPDDVRRCFMSAVMQYAIDGEDGYLLRNTELQSMLSLDEDSRLKIHLRADLIPNLRIPATGGRTTTMGTERPRTICIRFRTCWTD